MVAQQYMIMEETENNESERKDEEVIDAVEERSHPEREAMVMEMTTAVLSRGESAWNVRLGRDQVMALLREALAIADVDFNAEVAAAWGEREFSSGIPREKVEADERELRVFGGDFDAMVQSRRDQLQPSRLNAERISQLTEGNPEIPRLLDLAEGMEVVTPPGFYPNGGLAEERPPLRKLYCRTHKAVDRMFYDLVEAGLAIVLTAATAFKIPGLHVSPAHWAPKPGKEHGRPLIDSTDANSPFPVLNSDYVSDWAKEYFGEIEHPTIVDIVLMIWDFKAAHPEVDWSQVALFKTDLKGAYNLISFKTRYCKLFAVELVGGLVVIFMCGLFGWSATPAAFQVITRAILYELGKLLTGRAKMYVDDILGVTLVALLVKELSTTRSVCTRLLGDGAVADEKTQHTEMGGPRRIDVIGYTLDMDLQVVTLTRRNLLRTLYAFFSVRTDQRVPIPALQRLASLASRYCAVLPELRPFSRALYACFAGISNRQASVYLSEEAKLSVELWRTLLCAIALDERRFARPFRSFVSKEASTIIQFDASLQGIGVVVYARDHGTEDDVLVGASAVPLTAWGLDEENSALQNTAEYMAVIVGIIAAVKCRPAAARQAIVLKGDSVTALRWAETGRVKSVLANRAACVCILLLVRLGIRVQDAIHVLAEFNVVCDLLSRRDQEGRYRAVQDVVPGAEDLKMHEDVLVAEALRLCNPLAGSLVAETFDEFWTAAGQFVARVAGASPQ
jgi:hypothetical protein